MRIGELAKRTGVSPRLLRYYEEQGLLVSQRAGNGYRHYPADAPRVVKQIRALLGAGLGTAVLRELLPCARGKAPVLTRCPRLEDVVARTLEAMQQRIDRLTESHSALRRYLDAARVADGPGNGDG